MKRIALFLCSALLVLAACNKHQNEYTINGHLDDADFEGKTVYLYDAFQGTELKSAVITNGTFTFTDTVSSPVLVSIRTVDGEEINYSLMAVLEPGTIYADLVTDSLSGTALNDNLHKFVMFENEIGDGLQEDYTQMMIIEDEAEQKEAMKEFEARYEEAMAQYNQIVNQNYNENKSNILGVYFLNYMQELTYEQLNTMLQDAAPIKVVCKVSVHTTVFSPPLKVYNSIMIIITQAVTHIGMPHASKTKVCKTKITKYIRNAEPSKRDRMNRAEPVFCAVLSMRCPRNS